MLSQQSLGINMKEANEIGASGRPHILKLLKEPMLENICRENRYGMYPFWKISNTKKEEVYYARTCLPQETRRGSTIVSYRCHWADRGATGEICTLFDSKRRAKTE